MYTNDESAVKVGDKVTHSFNCNTGVKQGCMLSPTLFNIFLHDLHEIFYDEESKLTVVNNSPVKCLLYADDLVIMSTTQKSLQHQLNELKIFCASSK